jgi:thymidylate kinase
MQASRGPAPTGFVRLVSFSGMDGAGKSTQIAALRAALEAEGLRVRIITFWDDVARLKGLREASSHTLFKSEKGVGRPDAPVNRRDKNVRSAPMTVVRLGLYLLDALSLRVVVRRMLRSPVDCVICDRYCYDELANLNLQQGMARLYARLILAISPRPGAPIILDAVPAEARARKPEYPLDFLEFSRQSYARLAALAGLTLIPPGSPGHVSRGVLNAVRSH